MKEKDLKDLGFKKVKVSPEPKINLSQACTSAQEFSIFAL
jgi:hypothetical protein